MRRLFLALTMVLVCSFALAKESLRVFTWDGYVTPADVAAVNQVLTEKGYDIEVQVIAPYATGPEQMFEIIRSEKADVTFLTLNYIKMQNERTSKLLQTINTKSPRLGNYGKLRKELTALSMGMASDGPLYIPWGGGTYGIWANMKKLKKAELPVTVGDLWDARWKGKISLSHGQIQPNIALTLLALGKPPFLLNDLMVSNQRDQAFAVSDELQGKVNRLYGQVARFWDAAPDYGDDLLLTASYGIELARENANGGKWELVKLKEGSTVWLDTINFTKGLTGKKLEAAEIFANYFIGKDVQTRVVKELSMVAVSHLANSNPIIEADPEFFAERMFWPPYHQEAADLMRRLSNKAMRAAAN
ncbi:MAG: extracellular solute-binding protein [Rhodocyclaceae bacterium]|nr:extracellular solute-binding protein [Rhodocyclaceae bacterium]